ncbi:MAG: hypothetical protein ACXABN_16960 [Candidatus Thorarchaeota archaeon]|jgi:hypothetical protein
MEIRRLDIVDEIELAALRILLAADPDPEGDPTMKQVQALAMLLKEALGKDRHHLRHDVLRVITGVPIISQWGLSSWYHHQLINYLKEELDEKDIKKKRKWKASLRGRRLVAECARVAEAVASQHEDHMDRSRAQAGMWDVWDIGIERTRYARSDHNPP